MNAYFRKLNYNKIGQVQFFFIEFSFLFSFLFSSWCLAESAPNSVDENLLILNLIRESRDQNFVNLTEGTKKQKKTIAWYKYPRLFFNNLIYYYQRFVSSQDMQVCNFTPSCSHFGQQVILRYGLFKGCLLIGDRLFRCNPLAHQHHTIHPRTGLCDDPITNYDFSNYTK